MLVAVLGFWAWQWQAAPAAGGGIAAAQPDRHAQDQEDGQDDKQDDD